MNLHPGAPAGSRASPSGNRVHIGLDYGTFSTKVILRGHEETRGKVLLLDEKPTEGYPSFATPSAVRIQQDRIFFGGRAVTEQGGMLIKSRTRVVYWPTIEARMAISLAFGLRASAVCRVIASTGVFRSALVDPRNSSKEYAPRVAPSAMAATDSISGVGNE